MEGVPLLRATPGLLGSRLPAVVGQLADDDGTAAAADVVVVVGTGKVDSGSGSKVGRRS